MSDCEKPFLSQFGKELWSPVTNEKVDPSSLSGKIVALYFSAHWCPPCRMFTPALIELYNKLKQDGSEKDTFEFVFCSLDRQESEYEEYTSTMPWKCMPFNAPESQAMARKYGARGIPHLVVIDLDRSVITTDGRAEVQQDPQGQNFPWKPKPFSEIWPAQVLTKEGLKDSKSFDQKYLMLYFSAHWCPPCRRFTPKLCQAYNDLTSQRDDFELCFVSSDRDEASFNGYYSEMPFAALPFENRQAKQLLSKRFGIQGIPSLLILGPLPEGGGDRPLVNDNVRGFIDAGQLSEFPFLPKPYKDLAVDADGINDTKSLVIFCENEDDDEQAELVDLVKKVAEKMKKEGKGDGMGFFYAAQPGGAVDAIRKALKIDKQLEGVIMALVDIPDNGGYYISENSEDLDEDKVVAFLQNPGDRQQLTPS